MSRPRPSAHVATIDGRAIAVQPRETLLSAAVRQGVEVPYGCRVGGCGACKCRLVEGEVKELTETGYLLSADELAAGYVLACQSVPVTDVRIEVAAAPLAQREVRGEVVEQRRLTDDMVALRARLDEPLRHRAGQFALVSLTPPPKGARPGDEAAAATEGSAQDRARRSYSFASAAAPDGREVSFLVRRVEGGALSPRLYDEELVGRPIWIDGPRGDFGLRPGRAPVVLVAGGSGLAPMLAMLEEEAAVGEPRSVTLLYGVRAQRDLCEQERVAALARTWRGDLRFVPVLSEEPLDSSWRGARGLVTSHLARVLVPDAQVYLCGPPAMVDAAQVELARLGVAADRVRADRFTTAADAAGPPAAVDGGGRWSAPRGTGATSARGATLWHYAKFFLFHAIGLVAATAILAGGAMTTAGLAAVMTGYMLGDAVLGDDTGTPVYRHPRVLTVQLWLALPLLVGIVFSALWTVSPGDPLGFGAWLSGWSGYDVLAARAASGPGTWVSTVVLTGLMIGMVGTIPGHELTHRTWDPVSLAVGRWLLAFSFDVSFAIEHVYGHHRYVSTTEDPATAPRGRSVYAHVVISTVRGNLSAWRIESERLRKRRHAVWGWRNAVLRGYAMSLVLVAGAYALGGGAALVCFCASALWGKALLEIVNYMEHYGMVRDPRRPVEPRHSWNTNRRVSSWAMFNLTRHSHHHAQGEVPYHELAPYPDAPMMISGYLTTILVAMVPPLWHALMTPRVLDWDRRYASEDERALAQRANRRSGISALQRTAGASGAAGAVGGPAL